MPGSRPTAPFKLIGLWSLHIHPSLCVNFYFPLGPFSAFLGLTITVCEKDPLRVRAPFYTRLEGEKEIGVFREVFGVFTGETC